MEATQIAFDLRGIGSELKDRLLAVPIYQRSFAWTPEEVTEYWEDLRNAFSESSSEYFLGTIVLTKQGSPPRDTIIDGQQRLATTTILLSAIRDEYKSREDTKRAQIIQDSYLSTSDLASATDIARLSLNSDDVHFFNQRIAGGQETPEPTRKSHEYLLSAYLFFREQIRKVSDDAGPDWSKRLNEWVDFLRLRLRVIVLEVPTEADAFLIFETLNDRGADLTIADLLKNYLFGHAGTALDSVRDGWMMTLGALEITSENTLFTTFLRHYWSSHYGATRERDLYKSIKEHISTQTHVSEFVNDLLKTATLYSALLASDHEYWEDFGSTVRENMQTLLRLELEQHRPLLLAALQHFSNKEAKKLLKLLVSWSVRGLIVGGIGGGTAEKNYCRAAVKIRKGEIKTTSELLDEISAIVPNDEQFESAFAIARAPKARLARYYLIALEGGVKNEAEPEMVPNANEEQVNLEHVLPKRATEKDWGLQFDAEECKTFLHRIGNLALLQKGPNSRIGNKPFSQKRTLLSKSALALTSEVGKEADWTKDTLNARQVRLAKLAVKVWSRS